LVVLLNIGDLNTHSVPSALKDTSRKVYHMTQKNVRVALDVVTSTFLLDIMLVYALFLYQIEFRINRLYYLVNWMWE
jgi:hypothetical protein